MARISIMAGKNKRAIAAGTMNLTTFSRPVPLLHRWTQIKNGRPGSIDRHPTRQKLRTPRFFRGMKRNEPCSRDPCCPLAGWNTRNNFRAAPETEDLWLAQVQIVRENLNFARDRAFSGASTATLCFPFTVSCLFLFSFFLSFAHPFVSFIRAPSHPSRRLIAWLRAWQLAPCFSNCWRNVRLLSMKLKFWSYWEVVITWL